jgi:hypothetical protein
MVCGLHVAVAARATYSLYLARQQLKEEVASEPDEPEAEPIVQVGALPGCSKRPCNNDQKMTSGSSPDATKRVPTLLQTM